MDSEHPTRFMQILSIVVSWVVQISKKLTPRKLFSLFYPRMPLQHPD